MPVGPFGQALMRFSRTPTPGVGARYGMRAPNIDAIRRATPTPGAIKPSEAASEAALPPEIQSYLGMLTGMAPGVSGAPVASPLPPGPVPVQAAPVGLAEAVTGAPLPVPEPELPQVAPPAAPMPTVSKAFRIRAPRWPDVDIQTLAITAPDESWRAAFYDRNGGRQPNPSDYEMRHLVADHIARTGELPTKAELLFSRFRFDREPAGISEFA